MIAEAIGNKVCEHAKQRNERFVDRLECQQQQQLSWINWWHSSFRRLRTHSVVSTYKFAYPLSSRGCGSLVNKPNKPHSLDVSYVFTNNVISRLIDAISRLIDVISGLVDLDNPAKRDLRMSIPFHTCANRCFLYETV